MRESRSGKVMRNTVYEVVAEIVSVVCGLVLPRLILSHFGSAYNGVTSSISQFISCIAIMKSGIGGVTRAALYKPLAEKNSRNISEIANATSGFMRRVAFVFAISSIVFASLYPFLVAADFDWFFTFTLVIILSLSTFFQYFFGLTYQMILQADQKNYIISFVSILQVVANTIVASILILFGFGIHIVKLGSALVFILPPIFYNVYVKKKYGIDRTVPANYHLISQRWDAFGHQVANFINNNTDIIVATVILGVREVSVYTVYHFVVVALKKAVTAIGSGTTSAFGNMIAKNETCVLKKRFEQFELLIYYITSILTTTSVIMITSFVRLYTDGVGDVQYIRPFFGWLICISIFFMCIKLPYEQLVYAMGEFRKTRNGAFIEASINVITSIILSFFVGLNGILIGTIIAVSYRALRYNVFVSHNILFRDSKVIICKILYCGIVIGVGYVVSTFFPLEGITSYFLWIKWSGVVFLMTAIISTGFGILFFRKRMCEVLSFLLRTVGWFFKER